MDEGQLKYNLVLCGSSQNMMYGLVLDSAAPLYGRADEINCRAARQEHVSHACAPFSLPVSGSGKTPATAIGL